MLDSTPYVTCADCEQHYLYRLILSSPIAHSYLPVANEVWYMEHVRCCLEDVMNNINCPEIFVESEVSFTVLYMLVSQINLLPYSQKD